MCGHGTIGTVTFALEEGLVKPKTAGVLVLDTPAGVVRAEYEKDGKKVTRVKITNVPSFLFQEGLKIKAPELGDITLDIAYGGNFYAIIDPQKNYKGLEAISAFDIQRLSPQIKDMVNQKITVTHPENDTIRGVSHVMWTGKPQNPKANGKNAVFYGDKAIDRSPCGTGTSARMAQLAAKGKLKKGQTFIHESIIGSLFEGKVEDTTQVGGKDAIIPSVAGWAMQTGKNIITIDPADPFWKGFLVK